MQGLGSGLFVPWSEGSVAQWLYTGEWEPSHEARVGAMEGGCEGVAEQAACYADCMKGLLIPFTGVAG